jgi:uncharacterized protein (TIGR03000 family)
MFRRIASMTGLIALAVLGSLLSARPAAAQNQGYSVWAHRGGGGGGWGGGGGYFVPSSPAYYAYPPAFVTSAPPTRTQAFYYAPAAPSPGNAAVSINMAVPANAKVSFDGAVTTQTGRQRLFVSPPLRPGNEYAYDVVVKWTQDGREVTQNRRLTVHAGDVLNLTFPETGQARAR